jgi:hypothetical protein
LNQLDQTIAAINGDIESMNNQNELQQGAAERYNERREAQIAKDQEALRQGALGNHKKVA